MSTQETASAAVEAESSEKKNLIALNDIEVLKSIQVRQGISHRIVTEYAEFLKDKKNDLPDIMLFEITDSGEEIDGHLVIADGIHRFLAYKEAGRKKIPYKKIIGTRFQAIRYGIDENLKHGQLFDREDKKRALALLMEDPQYAGASVRELAAVLHLSHGSVGEMQRELKGGESQAARARRKRQEDKAKVEAAEDVLATQIPVAEPAKVESIEVSVIKQKASATEQAEVGKHLEAHEGAVGRCLGVLDGWIRTGVLTEDDIIRHFDQASFAYVWLPRPDSAHRLQVNIDGEERTFVVRDAGPCRLIVEEVASRPAHELTYEPVSQSE